jgi:hypothetical protein
MRIRCLLGVLCFLGVSCSSSSGDDDGPAPDIEAGLVAPEQYFDVFIVSLDGIAPGDAAPVQRAFGL